MPVGVSRIGKWLQAIVLVTAAFWIAASPALAQCSMCYTTAAAQGAEGIRALNIGIIVLLIPPVTIMGGILLYAFRCRNSQELWKRRVPESPSWALETAEQASVALPRQIFERPVGPLS